MENIAVYTLVPLEQPQEFFEAVRLDKDMNEDPNEAPVALAPKYDFSNSTFAELFDYHLDLTSKDATFDYSNFIVAVHEDYAKHGVFVVCLLNEYYDDITAVPTLARATLSCHTPPPDENITAVAWCINFQVANMDISDMKDFEDSVEWPEEIPGYSELLEDLTRSGEELKATTRARYALLPKRRERYAVHHIADSDRDTGTMSNDVEPDVYYKETADMADRVATTRGVNNVITHPRRQTPEELWESLRKLHPGSCKPEYPRTEPFWRVNKYWVFAFDRSVASNEGVALVRVVWDGVTEGRSKEELENVMPRLEVVERQPHDKALARMDEVSGFKAT